MERYIVVTHTDMDGVGSASLYIYLQGSDPDRIVFTEPYLLDKGLRKAGSGGIGDGTVIAVMDLSGNPSIFNKITEQVSRLRSRGVKVEWYDHHVWNKEWIDRLSELGVDIHVDRSTCAAGVVAKYAPRRRSKIDGVFVDELVRGVCAGDLWRFDHWRGPWYLRLVRRNDSMAWRRRVISIISKGEAWNEEFTRVIEERIDAELREYGRLDEDIIVREINGIRIAIAPSSRIVDNSFTAAYIMGRTGADIAGIVSRDGKLSLRSRRHNIRDLAVSLGGGGHPRAAGALVKLPFLVRLRGLFNKRVVIEFVLDKISSEIGRVSPLEP